ncbi:hypothetical protein [Clavibacter tessellarius]
MRDAVTNFLKAYLDGDSAAKASACTAAPISDTISDSASSCTK